MSVSATSYWGRRALDFVDEVHASTRIDEIASRFAAVVAEIGFHAYIMADIPRPGQSLEQLVVANGWPPEWFDLYEREKLALVDPVPRHCFGTVNPFEWSEAPIESVAGRGVMEKAIDFNFRSGFCIPLHYEDSTGAISMAGDKPELVPETKRALHLMAVFAHGRLAALRRPKIKMTPQLTEREAEVLTWAANGKTSWETAQILRIAERTVKWHLAEAQRKLCTTNKTAAVARALVQKEIGL